MISLKVTPSKPWKLVFFKKEGCKPCETALINLNNVLEKNDAFYGLVTVMQKEYHSALVASYNLKMYPTVLVLDKGSDEIGRKVGVKHLTEDWWEKALTAILKNRHDHTPIS